jgi:hypothetical protein
MKQVYQRHEQSPTSIYVNTMYEFYPLVSDIAVFTADVVFQDWNSFCFYLGDTVYRTFVVNHSFNINF